ncbi:MAG TPA: oxygenase MpaB family protein, partial [Ramlibacter sp.]|nr:oxygenase MpaB family protein [Ramlibacter sp.]
QMPASLWPADRAAFDAYWDRTVAQLHVEPRVRQFADALLDGGALPWWLRGAMPLQRFFTRGLLPPALRSAFGLPWTPRDQRRWDRFLRHGPRLYWRLPRWLRHLPASLVLRDMRRRLAAGRSPI